MNLLDQSTINGLFEQLINNDKAQRQRLEEAISLLEEASYDMCDSWCKKAEPFIKSKKPKNTSVQITDPFINRQINEAEKEFGEEMSESELANMFGETIKKDSKKIDFNKEEPFKGMTLEEINEWEKEQDNSNDLYKIKARITNLVSGSGGSLTSSGEVLVNSYVHTIKSLYDFASTIENKDIKNSLNKTIRSNEKFPAIVIDALKSGVTK